MGLALFVLPLSLTACSRAGGEDRMNQPTKDSKSPATDGGLELLLKAVLQFTSEAAEDAIVPPEDREGVYLGSGDGTATGERLRGTIRWSAWAGNCLYPLIRKGQPVTDELHLCTFNPTGFIETSDGARIRFEGRGYGLRSKERYRISVTLAFGTDDARYVWLTKVLGVTEGLFDEKAGRATWDVYVPAGSRS